MVRSELPRFGICQKSGVERAEMVVAEMMECAASDDRCEVDWLE